MSRHRWECVEVGNTYSEYKCEVCGAVEVIDMEDPGPPMEGCIDNPVGEPKPATTEQDSNK